MPVAGRRVKCLQRVNRRLLAACVIGWSAAFVAGQAHAQGAPPAAVLHYPDIVLVNGKVVTVDDRFSLREAVAIREDRILAVLTEDYLTVPEDRIRTIRAAMTIVGGKVVYEAKP